MKSNIISLLLVTICHTSTAWTTLQTSKVIPGVTSRSPTPSIVSNALSRSSTGKTPLTTLFESTNDDVVPKRKGKRKKKVQVVDVEEDVVATDKTIEESSEPEPAAEPEPAPLVLDLKPRDDAPVQLEVKNLLASDSPPEPSAIAQISNVFSSLTGGSNDSPSSSSAPSTTEKSMEMSSFQGRPMDASLDQLLEDARLMTEEEKEAKGEGGVFSDEEGAGVKEVIGNTLSTIVTVDFFVVCGFLAWFLLGIFCSYILKDDTIQIAFNNNFERLVQPALGILMIAALGGNFFKEKEEEYDL